MRDIMRDVMRVLIRSFDECAGDKLAAPPARWEYIKTEASLLQPGQEHKNTTQYNTRNPV